MQISRVEVVPVELKLQHPVRICCKPEIGSIHAVFVRLETRNGLNAWGAGVAHPDLTGEEPQALLHACQEAASLAVDLHPMLIEQSLARVRQVVGGVSGALCAFDLALHDLLGLAAGMPVYKLLGGYHDRIQTSATVPLAPVEETVASAEARARAGFRMLKIKGGVDAELDVQRVHAVHRALPTLILRLDADGGYTVSEALEVARALHDDLEMLEQPTPVGDMESLRQVTRLSPIPVLADQAVCGPESALALVNQRAASGLSIKVATCGGLSYARQVETISRAARLRTMVNCVIEPALTIAAGLSLALSSPNIHYCDLDGALDLINDPTMPGYRLKEGWLIASDVPGLGCTVNLQ